MSHWTQKVGWDFTVWKGGSGPALAKFTSLCFPYVSLFSFLQIMVPTPQSTAQLTQATIICVGLSIFD